MFDKLNKLSFVIGLFFLITSVILFVNLFAAGQENALNIYTASAYLLFGVIMMSLK